MKKLLFLVAALAFLLALPAFGQETETRKALRPEFTVRMNAGIPYGYAITGGVRLNDNLTLGLMAWKGYAYIDAVPAHIHSATACAYMRYYIHLGPKDIVAIYSDLNAGARFINKVDGYYRPEDKHPNPGDIEFAFSWQPGIRIRFYRNLHLFLGPTIGDSIGLHLGLGF